MGGEEEREREQSSYSPSDARPVVIDKRRESDVTIDTSMTACLARVRAPRASELGDRRHIAVYRALRSAGKIS